MNDRQVLRLQAGVDYRTGSHYVFRLGVWDEQAGEYLPLTIDGKPAGEFYQVPGVPPSARLNGQVG